MNIKKLAVSLLFILSASLHAQDIPVHLQYARQMVQAVKPETNKYSTLLSYQWVIWKENTLDFNTDCVGFVNYVFENSNKHVIDKVKDGVHWERRVRTDNYYEAISKNIGFTHIKHVQDILPGDIVVFQFLKEYDRNRDLGHIMIIDTKPRAIKPVEPSIENTKQWVILVLDSTGIVHGKTDSRVGTPAEQNGGLGRGPLRLFTTDDGEIVGYGPAKTNPIIVGRPN